MDSKRKPPPVWSPGGSQIVLLLAGVVAWTSALGLCVNGKSATVATAFVTAGLVLIAGAAFYERIRKFGPGGVEMDPLKVLGQIKAELPPPVEGTPPDAERSSLLGAFEGAFEAQEISVPAPPTAEPTPGEVGVQLYERGLDLELRVRDWLAKQGMTVEGGHQAGVDLIAREGEDVTAIVFKAPQEGNFPTPEALRSAFAFARTWADQTVGANGAFYRVAMTDVTPDPAMVERYKEHGIGLRVFYPGVGTEGTIWLDPKNSRE